MDLFEKISDPTEPEVETESAQAVNPYSTDIPF
jgi:hypothetical protein